MKYLILFTAFLLAGCYSEKIQPVTSPILKAHANQFVSEAAKRGIQIDITDLTIYFDDLSKVGAAGGVLKTGEIVIDSSSINWQINPESVVFHEMGHKYLHRGHVDDTYPAASVFQSPKPKSIMHSRFIYLYAIDRELFINELFSLN